ncbi:hypothetical protein [Acidithiobacillus caldus]|uniref:Uncharacterized protein n=3 Tax=Acidithiobacillus caldus TaxID=33059 RepID=A0A059ZYP3_ACICK|nr:hypothetical protein [Acidithiobacillus caldus]AIA56578.1 hypothetical protein Acaty_m0005 [Acidithiobacillus caldus ATCC 51756]MBU2730320.1 hypothetical protein [Acidithiobacillus caldus]MBU2746563.1 hypothetical protein [Acidithiobacillus caldus]MBU2780887.1 hypothetical protein [Acidithiobacillus caldus]OFC37622.1 hypothetical protein BAE29_10260 [Acidithiobacillus caldus]
MSVTYTCKRVAAAFRDGDDVVYALGEVTYESNVYPHTRHLSTTFIGKLPDAIKTVFAFAADTCGGDLNSPDRKMTPERYIKSALNALKQPLPLDPDMPLHISSWDKETVDRILNTLQERGTPAILRNHYDVPRINWFVKLPFSDEGRPLLEPCPDLGYQPKKSAELPQVNFGKVLKLRPSSDNWFVRIDADGKILGRPEWQYRILGDYVSSIWETELTHPGSYKKLIPAFRDYLRDLPQSDVLCVLDPGTKYYGVDEMIAKYGDGEFLLSSVDQEDLYKIYAALKSVREV